MKNGLIKSFDDGDRYDAYGIDVSDRAFGLTIELLDKSVIDVNHIRLTDFTDVVDISASSLVEVSDDISFAGGDDALLVKGAARVGSLDLGSGDDYVQQLGRLTVFGDLLLGSGDDLMITNGALFVDGVLDGGEGDDVVGFFSLSPLLKEFPASKIENVERTVQLQGKWSYSGDIRASSCRYPMVLLL